MKQPENEHELFQEFADFVETEQKAPGKRLDAAVLGRVRNDLSPALWKVYGKFTLIEASAGLLTLTICPQFGFGFGPHNQFLHALHSSISPVVFYLLCGLFFVIFGAALGGLILNRTEISAVGSSKYLYFSIYSALSYLIIVSLGPEAFVISSLVWILGALLGSILGFEAIIRLRHATA